MHQVNAKQVKHRELACGLKGRGAVEAQVHVQPHVQLAAPVNIIHSSIMHDITAYEGEQHSTSMSASSEASIELHHGSAGFFCWRIHAVCVLMPGLWPCSPQDWQAIVNVLAQVHEEAGVTLCLCLLCIAQLQHLLRQKVY